MVSSNYGADIRRMSDEYAELKGGQNPFTGISLGHYYFDEGYIRSGTEAFGYMKARLQAARDHTPEPEFPE